MSNRIHLETNDDIAQDGKYLTFEIGEVEYGLAIGFVTEIIGLQKITNLPDMPNYVRGVINMRGKVIPLIDVRLRIGIEERAYDERTCIIVTDIKDTAVGLIVDRVKEVMDIPEKQIDPPPKVKKGAESRFIDGLAKVGDKVNIILDMDKFLFDKELKQLNQKDKIV
jgi:purine-binding chemotaxis protein CheW